VAQPTPGTLPQTYRGRMHAPITGTAAGVPFTALPPAEDGPAPPPGATRARPALSRGSR